MSIEAMAMAGMDYKECAINLQESDQPPLHLRVVEQNVCLRRWKNVECMKAELRKWAKAVAFKQDVLCKK